jgi:DtxR family Mn-dependent transcriptional regulator
MPSSTVENYVKQIYLEQQKETPGGLLSMGKLAAAMGVTPGTATAMIKTLHESGLVEYEPRNGVRLSKGGQKLAMHVLRRHRLVELFLVEILKLDWTEVHEEAEALEHVISDRVLDRIDQMLKHPDADPHGDPIPTAAGKIARKPLRKLAECGSGEEVRVARILDQNAEFLQFANRSGLTPGARITISRNDAVAQSITVCARPGEQVNLGASTAANILVETGA